MLRGGQVVQERVVDAGADVTVGTSPRNTLVVEGDGLPRRHRLFLARGSRYQLAFTQAMTGKVVGDRGIDTLHGLRADSGTRRRRGTWLLTLSDQSRGKLTLGELTVLFQFVPAPLESARSAAATDFRPRLLDDDDPVFLGFLSLFTALGAALMAYAFSVEPVDLMKGGEIPDRFVEVLMHAPPTPVTEDEAAAPESELGTIVKREVEVETTPVERQVEPKSAAEAAAAAAAKAVQTRDDTIRRSKLLTILIGTRGEAHSDQTVIDLFGTDDVKLGRLQDVLQTVDGTAVASAASIIANKGATDGRGRGDSSIGAMKRAETGEGVGVGDGPGTTPTARMTQDELELPAQGSGAAGRTVRTNKGQIQACYERELTTRPSLRGRLAVSIDVVAGQVRGVSIEDNGTGSAAMEQCVIRKLRRWHFDESVTGEVYSVLVLEPSG